MLLTISYNETVSLTCDSFKITTNYNTDGWGNKLVTVFAGLTPTRNNNY